MIAESDTDPMADFVRALIARELGRLEGSDGIDGHADEEIATVMEAREWLEEVVYDAAKYNEESSTSTISPSRGGW